jgi:hypothetical protein
VKVVDLSRGIMPEGELEGLPYFSHGGSVKDKTKKLSTRNTSLRPYNGLHRIVDDPNDPIATYKLIDFLIKNHLPPGWKSYILSFVVMVALDGGETS